jgi:DNA-binding transcriptional ArsR family regulator
METEAIVAALAGLAHPARLEIFRALVQAGPPGLAAGAISERFGLPPATASFHLAALSNAGLIGSQRAGRQIIYAADYAAMRRLTDYLAENCCQGAACAPGQCD